MQKLLIFDKFKNRERVNLKEMTTLDVVSNSYTILGIIPTNETENKVKELENLIKGFSSMYRSVGERMDFKVFGKKVLQKPYRFSYEVLISNKSIMFFYRIPEDYETSLVSKMEAVWPKAQIKPMQDPIHELNLRASSYKRLSLKDYNFKSLLTDMKTNEPLPSIFNIQGELQDTERILIQFLFYPLDNSWNDNAKVEYDDYIHGKLKKKTTKSEKFFAVTDYIMKDAQYITDCFFGGKSEPIGDRNVRLKSEMTDKHKMLLKGFKTDIKIIASTREVKRREMLIHSVASSFKVLSKDNELIEDLKASIVYPKNVDDIRKRKISTSTILSEREVMQVMQMPEKSLQDKFKMEKVDTLELDIPKAFLNGNIRIAKIEKKGRTTYITLPEDHKSACKPFALVGPAGGGKTTTMQNILLDICNQTNHGMAVFDYIKDNEMAKYILARIADDSGIIVVDMTDINNLPNINICELDVSGSEEERYKNADTIYLIFKKLIGQIKTDSTEDMTVRMLKYLRAACIVVFIHKDKSIFDAYKVLEDYKTRHEYIDEALKLTQRFNPDTQVIKDLLELDTQDKKTRKWGTDSSKIAGILDRLSMFSNSYHMELMLKSKRELNFVDIMNEGKRIFFLMPDHEFIEKSEVDVIVNCMLAKMWVAWKKRGKGNLEPRIFHVAYDEVNLCLHAQQCA